MDKNRDLIYLRIEAEAIKREKELGVTQTYTAELARVSSIVNDLAEEARIDTSGSSYDGG